MREVSVEIRRKVFEVAQNRCGYCLSHQCYVMSKLEIEHIIPKSNGGTNAEENLWLSCGLCNHYKGSQTDFSITNYKNLLTYTIREHKFGPNILPGISRHGDYRVNSNRTRNG